MNTPFAKSNAGMTALLVAIHAACWVTLVLVLFLSVPAHEKIFRDFKMRIPWFTGLVMDVTAFLGNWYVLFIVTLFVLASDGTLLFLMRRNSAMRTLSWIWFAFVIIVILSLAVTTLLSMELPMVNLIQKLSQP